MKRYCIIVVVLLTISALENLTAQVQTRYDKAFFQGEMNRYTALMHRGPSTTAATSTMDVTYYRLNLTITTSPQYLSGSVLMKAFSKQDDLEVMTLDLMQSMTVDSVRVAGTSVPFVQSSSSFDITLGRPYNNGELMTVEVFYEGRPGSSGFGSFEFSSHSSTPWVWSLSEPYGAKDWWPCKDHPSDKADSADMFITCETAFKVGSNGKLVTVTDKGDGTHTYHWHEGYPISTYLISVAITNYADFSSWFKYTPTDSMQILNYVLPEHLSSAQSQLPLVVGELQIYSSLFGLYPFINEKYGHSEFGWGGGMEHQTMTSLGGFGDWLTAHELAHQWFGDMITCRNWPDIWLNEGFATFCELVYEEHKYGEGNYWGGINSDMASAKATTASVYVSDSESVGSLFDWNRVYAKGAIVLHMLRHVLGDSTFFHSMYNYATDPAFRFNTAATADFEAVCESTSGKSLSYFFNEWVYGHRYPHYSTGWTADSTGNGYVLTVGVSQTTGTTNPTFFTMPVDFKIVASGWDTTVVFFNDARTQTFSLTIPYKPLSIQLDPQGWILKDKDTLTAFLALPSVLDMGTVYLPVSKSDSIVVHNAGLSALNISTVVSDDTTITVSPSSATISPSSSQTFDVTFHPVAVGTKSAHIYFYHDAPGSPATVGVSVIGAIHTYEMSGGWNLVSLPLAVDDPRTAAVFSTAVSPAYSYATDSGYAICDSLRNGAGYWLKFSAMQQMPILGTAVVTDSFSVKAGWNLIGSISTPLAAAQIVSDPPGIVTSQLFGYDRGYFISDTLAPAKGYWVKVNRAGNLILSGTGAAAEGRRIKIVATSEFPPNSPNERIPKPRIPGFYALEQNYPNPFNPTTNFRFQIPARPAGGVDGSATGGSASGGGFVSLKVYDVLGREVATLVNEVKQPGEYNVMWNAANVPSGVYFYKITAGKFSSIRKLSIIK